MYAILNADSKTTAAVFEELSLLDRSLVGAEGWSAESFRSEAEKENGIVLYAVDSGKVIALLSGYYAVGEGDITGVAVDEKYRRQGIALRLIERFTALLPEDTENIYLEVRESNTPAQALYRKCGFEKLAVRRNFYDSPCENAIVMEKKLR